MKNRNKVVLSLLALCALLVVLTVHWFWPRPEVQVCDTRKSPDGKWTAVVQMEVYSAAAFVTDAVYAVRLKGPQQRDRQGDLVMNVPVNYPNPAPFIDWSDGKLVVTLPEHEQYQYLSNPTSGVPIAVQHK